MFEFLTLLQERPAGEVSGTDWRDYVTPEVVIQILKLAAVIFGFSASAIPEAVPSIMRAIRGTGP